MTEADSHITWPPASGTIHEEDSAGVIVPVVAVAPAESAETSSVAVVPEGSVQLAVDSAEESPVVLVVDTSAVDTEVETTVDPAGAAVVADSVEALVLAVEPAVAVPAEAVVAVAAVEAEAVAEALAEAVEAVEAVAVPAEAAAEALAEALAEAAGPVVERPVRRELSAGSLPAVRLDETLESRLCPGSAGGHQSPRGQKTEGQSC